MLGKSILVVLCAGSTLLLTPVVRRPSNSQPTTPSEATLFSYWSIKPWFLTERKVVVVLITPYSWGSQRVQLNSRQLNTQHTSRLSGAVAQASRFSRAVAGVKKHFCKGSLSLSIILLCF